MQRLELQQGETYSLKVTEVKWTTKQIRKKDGELYRRYDVTIEDKNGASVKAEYLTRHPHENETSDAFSVGVFQYIRCGFLSPGGTPEIEPAEEPSAGLGTRYTPARASVDNRNTNKTEAGESVANCYSLPVSGRAITYTTGYAKDILIAEMAHWPSGRQVTEQDIGRVQMWANSMAKNICDKLNP